ncbi:MAG: Fic family protein [Negativicutes bacterium]|nr:Fic family protein [Negativicutes bacterium]
MERTDFSQPGQEYEIPVTELFIQRLHAIIEVRRAGRRQKYSVYRGPTPAGVLFAVRDSVTGAIDYIPPEAADVPYLMKDFVEWLNSESANELPVPVRAAISAYQLLTIHPFPDGNGRTARALATYILSSGGYDLKGFYSLEEFYWHDLTRYYANLQMGLPPLYYEGRANPPDLAPWINYFTETMALAFKLVAEKASAHYNAARHPLVAGLNPNEREILRLILVKNRPVTPAEMAATLNGAPLRTVRRWCEGWVNSGILEPASGVERVRSYQLGARFKELTLKDLGYEDAL